MIMSSYKRKRIENWVDEVALYLRNGTICRSVIGHVAEDAINGCATVSSTTGGTKTENGERYGADGDRETEYTRRSSGGGSLSNRLKKNGMFSNGEGAVNNVFPVVRFAYSHYHEQRRKIDRLVQGLPVLNAGQTAPTADRPASRESADDNAPIIFVNGEEPVVSRPNAQPWPAGINPYSTPPMLPGHNPSYSSRQHQIHVSHTTRNLPQPFRSPGAINPHGHLESAMKSSSKLSSQIRGSNASYSTPRRLQCRFHESRGSDVTIALDPSLETANDRVARSKTAPTPNRNLHRARQRILTRRGNRVLDQTAQIPLQHCWAMAELSW